MTGIELGVIHSHTLRFVISFNILLFIIIIYYFIKIRNKIINYGKLIKNDREKKLPTPINSVEDLCDDLIVNNVNIFTGKLIIENIKLIFMSMIPILAYLSCLLIDLFNYYKIYNLSTSDWVDIFFDISLGMFSSMLNCILSLMLYFVNKYEIIKTRHIAFRGSSVGQHRGQL